MRRRRNIQKLAFILILSLCLTLQLFADGTSYMGVGSPASGGSVGLNVQFVYDPELMQRLTFGFTESTDIEWMDSSFARKDMSLGTQVMQGRGELARGLGNVNFYWILRTNKPVSAKLYLNAPLKESTTLQPLDWSIQFDSMSDDVVVSSEQIDSLYGINNSKEIYSRKGGVMLSPRIYFS